MMCDACKQGGIMNSIGQEQLAHERHKACEYASCACQHRVGKAIYQDNKKAPTR